MYINADQKKLKFYAEGDRSFTLKPKYYNYWANSLENLYGNFGSKFP